MYQWIKEVKALFGVLDIALENVWYWMFYLCLQRDFKILDQLLVLSSFQFATQINFLAANSNANSFVQYKSEFAII